MQVIRNQHLLLLVVLVLADESYEYYLLPVESSGGLAGEFTVLHFASQTARVDRDRRRPECMACMSWVPVSDRWQVCFFAQTMMRNAFTFISPSGL